MLTEIVYKGADNPNSVTFYEDNVAMDFSATTRMLLTFTGSSAVVDTDISAIIDWSSGGGLVVFNLNDISISSGSYTATLKVYDAAHADGQVISHALGAEIVFRFA